MVIIAASITDDEVSGREFAGLPGVLRQACLLL